MNINLGKGTDINLPVLINSRLLIQANSGGGKSWAIRRLLEQTHGKVQQIVIDLEGEFSTLREKYDYILAGKDGDTPADPKTAALLARRLLELNVSAIIDLYELPQYERRLFVKNFLTAMTNAPKELWHECLVIVDEAHVFCPEKGQSEASEAVIDLATRGRKRGYAAVLATQRLSKLHKDAAAECNNKLIGRTGLDVDMKRASEELGFTSKDQYLSLRGLDPGEFFAFGPALSKWVTKTTIGPVETSHPSVGSRIVRVKPAPPTAKIRSVLQKLSDLPAEARHEAVTMEQLRRDNADLRRKLTIVEQAGGKQLNDHEKLEVVLKHPFVLNLRKENDELGEENRKLANEGNAFRDALLEILSAAVGRLKAQRFMADHEKRRDKKPIAARATLPEKPVEPPITKVYGKGIVEAAEEMKADASVGIKAGARRILEMLAFEHGKTVTKQKIGLFVGMKITGGTFNSYISVLKTNGFISVVGDNVSITETGLSHLGSLPERETGEDILNRWRKQLKRGAIEMLEVIVARHELTKDELADTVGMTGTGGTFNSYLSNLKTAGLITVDGPNIALSEDIYQ